MYGKGCVVKGVCPGCVVNGGVVQGVWQNVHGKECMLSVYGKGCVVKCAR